MSTPAVIQSARWAAAQRCRESARSDRLFSDPLAEVFAGEEGMTALRLSEQYNPRHQDTANQIALRVRFFDDVAQNCAAEGIRQFVLLAAGMDARTYRMNWPDKTTCYEVDHPELLGIKEEILRGETVEPKCRRVALGTDLSHDWAPQLIKSGFNRAERSAWLIEGLFYYLEEPAVEHVLRQVSGLATPGSVVVADLVSRWLLTSPWMQPALKAMEERGMGWRFGTDDPAGLFARHGWRAEVKDPAREGNTYDPKRFPVSASQSDARSPGSFVVARRT